ncbi:nuclear transport factor 2 family protein [Halomonas caseinilytica]|uniref:Ketosteroid isomerase-related protein n=1 Tax=Halomonas caseinilytica TaxID=438744 RepID=A0A1M6NGC5_9GAMM|nr:nuclear transport factor 2 family protein [Halomonas caseinilytica]SEM46235.1 Ketosteroid isomerase-related protein [Halomonas caseinilytica]SHJ94747.1 Ketosteroid isomerase-related protein [Halomonas caseinilytica]
MTSRLDIVKAYFRRVDADDPSVTALFTEDVSFYFPKFGPASGKAALVEFGRRVRREVPELVHDIERFHYIVDDDHVVVEGTEGGRLRNGAAWPDGEISQGRFCSVFAFEDDLICRMHIYVDPDFGNADQARLKAWRA